MKRMREVRRTVVLASALGGRAGRVCGPRHGGGGRMLGGAWGSQSESAPRSLYLGLRVSRDRGRDRGLHPIGPDLQVSTTAI